MAIDRVDRPFFVVGVDHSGTTILYRMLARHPELAWFSQYSLRNGVLPGRAWVPLNGWINRVGRRLTGFTWRKKERWVRPEPKEGIAIWRRLIPRDYEIRDESDCTAELAERLRAVVLSDLRDWGLERILIKSPYLTRCVLLLDRAFPDALYLHIVRDGRAVALSNRERIGRERGLGPRDALVEAALYWSETLGYIEECADRMGARFRTIRYEEFCEDVHAFVEDAFRYAGLDPEGARLEGVPRTLVPTNDRWLRSCSLDERGLLDNMLGPTLCRWGYDTFRDAGMAVR